MVERQPSKLNVASSSLVSRSNFFDDCPSSSGVERFLGKEEGTSSILVIGSTKEKVHPCKWMKFCISKNNGLLIT